MDGSLLGVSELSLLRQGGEKAALPLFRVALKAAGLGAGYKVLDWIGKNLPGEP